MVLYGNCRSVPSINRILLLDNRTGMAWPITLYCETPNHDSEFENLDLKIMSISTKNVVEVASAIALLILPAIASATPTVAGNVISWTEEGWHQVQIQSTYESVCNGGSQCTLPAGVYTVINHQTGQRFMNIVVPNPGSTGDDSPRAPVASTGQNISYAAGDDGDYQLGQSAIGQRFRDNGDGTFEDTFTGLTWLAVRDCIPRVLWAEGIDYANNFSASSGDCPELSDESVAGDWRLPNINELLSLMDYGEAFPAWVPEIPFSGNWIADPISGVFWSSTSFPGFQPEDTAYTLNSGVGLAQSTRKSLRIEYAWPVR